MAVAAAAIFGSYSPPSLSPTIDDVIVTTLAATRSMAPKTGNYLYVRRRQWALTQEELAFLLGYCTKTAVSKLEGRISRIPLRVALTSQIIFGIEPGELFPAVMEQVEESAVRRMYELYERLKNSRPSPETRVKLQLLHDALTRATGAAPQKI